MELNKKKRSENWHSEEKEILCSIVAQHAHVLENKSNNALINKQKTQEWKNVMKKFNEITGKNRSDIEIKLAWKRMKLAAKANISAHRQEIFKTGGGGKPPSPSQDDLAIMAIAPNDFIIEINDYDSDAIPHKVNENKDGDKDSGPTSATVASPVTEIICTPTCSKIQESYHEEKPDYTPNLVTTKLNKSKTTKHLSQNVSQAMRESIIESNVNFKKRQLEMLEVEHTYNIKIAQLKIRKLEIALMEDKEINIQCSINM